MTPLPSPPSVSVMICRKAPLCPTALSPHCTGLDHLPPGAPLYCLRSSDLAQTLLTPFSALSQPVKMICPADDER